MYEVSDQKTWDAFVNEHAPRSGAFLQSWKWGQMHESLGCEVLRLFEVGQFMRVPLSLGMHYWYCPRGPLCPAPAIFSAWEHGGVFVRFEPTVPVPKQSRVVKTVSIQPADTLLLSLTPSVEELLEAMHHKTRYNIRVAERKGVRVEREQAQELDDALWEVFQETGKRDKFRLHPRLYYRALLSICDLWVARKDGEPLAVALTIDFAGTRTFVHGASTSRHRDAMAPYAMHWAIIQDAKAKGIGWYDWWGISPVGDVKDTLAGVTRFKLGFGGERLTFPGTYDYLLHGGVYKAYTLARFFLRP